MGHHLNKLKMHVGTGRYVYSSQPDYYGLDGHMFISTLVRQQKTRPAINYSHHISSTLLKPSSIFTKKKKKLSNMELLPTVTNHVTRNLL